MIHLLLRIQLFMTDLIEGPYDQLPSHQEEVKKWCEANSLKYTQIREVFLKGK